MRFQRGDVVVWVGPGVIARDAHVLVVDVGPYEQGDCALVNGADCQVGLMSSDFADYLVRDPSDGALLFCLESDLRRREIDGIPEVVRGWFKTTSADEMIRMANVRDWRKPQP